MSDTSAIDEKKDKPASGSADVFSQVKGFVTSLIVAVLVVLLYFSSSGLVLFVCKLAQTNILPTESGCAPYTNQPIAIDKIQTNIFTTMGDPEMSMKLDIPNNDKNAKHRLIDMFKQYREKPNTHFLANYFISIIESLMQADYAFINTTMNALNGLPEIMVIALGPILASLLLSIGVLLNGLYFIYLWFANMYWFFQTNTNQSGEGLPTWEDVTITSPVHLSMGVGLVVLFAVLFLVGFPLLSFVPFIVLSYCALSCLFYKGSLNGKHATSLTIVTEVLKYYKVTVVSLISACVVLLAFSKLGAVPGMVSIVTVALVYYGMTGLDVFRPIPETNLSPSGSYEQARKTCVTRRASKDQHGFLYNMLLGQKGGLAKDLKKIGKDLLRK